MLLRVNNKVLCITLLLFAVSVVNAAPTLSGTNAACPSVSRTSQVDSRTVLERIEITKYSDSHLAAVAAQFLRPPSSSSVLAAAPTTHTRTLPAVPRAILLVLTGFLCVSLVKDRKIWLAALAVLIWVGQTGIRAFPELAVRLSHKTHAEQRLCAEFTYPHHFAISDRLHSDIEGTQYIGLLHHLAGILDSTTSFLRKQESRQIKDEFKVPQFAIIKLSFFPIPAIKCLAAKAEQFICFSPAFIFENLPRGPPELA